MQNHPRWEDESGGREQGCRRWCVLYTLKTVSTLNPLIFTGADFARAATSPKQRLRLQAIGRHKAKMTKCIYHDGFSWQVEIRTGTMLLWCPWGRHTEPITIVKSSLWNQTKAKGLGHLMADTQREGVWMIPLRRRWPENPTWQIDLSGTELFNS